jgi:predicted nucleic-acid-binding protein
LTPWSSQKFHVKNHVLKDKTAQLERLQRQENEANLSVIKTLKNEIEIILKDEDMRLKQRAK